MAVSSVTKNAPLTAEDAAVELACGGYGTVGFQIGGTWTGTISFEVTVDHGLWQTLNVTKTNSTSQVTTATGNGVWSGPIAGMLAVRARFSTYGSGTAQVQILIAGTGGGSGSGGGGGGGGGGTSSDFGNAFPAAGTAAGFLDSGGNMAPAEVTDDGELKVAGTFSIGGVGPTGDPVPADAIYVGVGDESAELVGLRSVARDLNSTTPPVVPVHGFYTALPGAGGPVVGGTTTNPIRVAGNGTAGTANAGVVTVQGIASMTPVAISAASLPLPTGAATEATLAALDAKVTVVDTSDVTITGALPAGNNNIGDVDVASVVPGTGASNLGKAEDSGHTSADVGVFALAVRQDTPNAAVTNTDADYSQVSVDKSGALRPAPIESDFAVLGSSHVKKYYTNAGAVTDGIIWSPAAGKRWYITSIFINVSAACTVTLEDDLAGGDSPIMKAEFAANSGWSSTFPVPWFSGEDAADLLITTTAGNVYVTVVGYEI